MVIRRSQCNRNNRIEQAEIDTFSDEESNACNPDLYTRSHFTETNEVSTRTDEHDHEESKIKQTIECTGKPYLHKVQHSAFNISDSTTIPLTLQNWQITSFVPDSTDLVVDSSNKCLAVRTVGMQRCPGFHKNVSFAK